MFIISEANPLGYLAMHTKTDNIRDIYDIILNITNDEKKRCGHWKQQVIWDSVVNTKETNTN